MRSWPAASKVINSNGYWWKTESENTGFLPSPTMIAKVINLTDSLNGLYRSRQTSPYIRQPGLDEKAFAEVLTARNDLVAAELDNIKGRLEALPMDYDGFNTIEKTIATTRKLSQIIDKSGRYPLNEYIGPIPFLEYGDTLIEFANKQAAIRSDQAASTLSKESAMANSRGQTRNFEERMKTTLGSQYDQTQIASQLQRQTDARNISLASQKEREDYNSAFFNIVIPQNSGNYSPPYLSPAEEALIPQHEQAQINSVSIAAELGPEICTTTRNQTLIGGWAAGAATESTSCAPDFVEGKKRQRESATSAPTANELYLTCATQLDPTFCKCLSGRNENHFTAEEFELFKQSPKTYAYYIKKRAFYDPMSLGANNLGNMLKGISALSSGNASGTESAFREMFLQRPSNAGDIFTTCAF